MNKKQKVLVILGHGIGPEIFDKVLPYISKVCAKYGKEIEWVTTNFPEGSPSVPQSVLDQLSQHQYAIKGPLSTPTGEGSRSYNVQMRQVGDYYACVRPVKWYEGVPAPLIYAHLVKTVIFRENTEDIYMGIEIKNANSFELMSLEKTFKQPDNLFARNRQWNFSLKPISKEGSERLIRAAIRYAIDNEQRSVTLVHKGNIMKATEGSFLTYGFDLADTEFTADTFTEREYNKRVKKEGEAAANEWYEKMVAEKRVYIKGCITDNMFQQFQLNPEQHPVIATMNLNGDYLSDSVAGEVGGVGIAPGANINYETGRGLYEATHGTAPKIAGKDMANPSSILLSGVMMFIAMGWYDVAHEIENGIATLCKNHAFTSDFADIYKKIHGSALQAITTTRFMELLEEQLQLVHA